MPFATTKFVRPQRSVRKPQICLSRFGDVHSPVSLFSRQERTITPKKCNRLTYFGMFFKFDYGYIKFTQRCVRSLVVPLKISIFIYLLQIYNTSKVQPDTPHMFGEYLFQIILSGYICPSVFPCFWLQRTITLQESNVFLQSFYKFDHG